MSLAVNKKEFVERYLDDCVRHACSRIERVWYSIDNPKEWHEEVTLVYSNGEEKVINVTGDNNLAIMAAVMEVLKEELL